MFRANIYGSLDMGMVTLQTLPLEVYTHRDLVADFIRLKIKFILKKSLFEPYPLGNLGNVSTLSIARWKARDRLPIRHNWTFFAISYGWDVTSGNLSKSACFEGGRSLWVQISDTERRRPPSMCWCQETRAIAVSCGIKTYVVHCLVLLQSTGVTEGQTDNQTDRITTANTTLA